MKINNQLIEKVEILINDLIEANNNQWGKLGDNYSYKIGKKFIKIISHSNNSQGVWGFIDIEGNILKAASWSKPAPHPRGNVYKGYPITGMRIYSPDYLRK
jgi:hypothetical protein